MTTPFERRSALHNINLFLIDMAWLRTRKERLERLRTLLKHYPSDFEIDLLFNEKWDEVFWGKRVTR